jgi:hypothetical protein
MEAQAYSIESVIDRKMSPKRVPVEGGEYMTLQVIGYYDESDRLGLVEYRLPYCQAVMFPSDLRLSHWRSISWVDVRQTVLINDFGFCHVDDMPAPCIAGVC